MNDPYYVSWHSDSPYYASGGVSVRHSPSQSVWQPAEPPPPPDELDEAIARRKLMYDMEFFNLL